MQISEFMPNPLGNDTEGEWIELRHEGDAPVKLAGWKLEDAAGKAFVFGDVALAPGEYLVLTSKATRIALNNNGESMVLRDASGAIIDRAGYQGTAREGESFVRADNGFVPSGQPTPGAANKELFAKHLSS